ncbi:hypothetical protein [Saccharomonospora halophila]|uniref:hypothetical protein n=1 Tax=Saccharomonospora halophila TaxID=129922 RepID=UPI00036880BB|nr:hypothetical protein [Saccharomonospora halophila]
MHGVVRRSVVPAAVLTVVVSACADGPDGPGGTDVSPTDTVPPTGRTTGAAEITVRGTVVRGVEPNCLVLSTGRREYLLVRPGPELRPGTEAVVRGTPRPGMPTTCMQGTPFVVREADRVGGGGTT